MSNELPRIRDDDELIGFEEMRALLGGPSKTTCYDDPELMSLKIAMTPPGLRTRIVKFIKREVLALRALRVERAEVNSDSIRAEIVARQERRRERQRLRPRRTRESATA